MGNTNSQAYQDFESVFDTLRMLERKKRGEDMTFDWQMAQVSRDKLISKNTEGNVKTGWLFYIRQDTVASEQHYATRK